LQTCRRPVSAERTAGARRLGRWTLLKPAPARHDVTTSGSPGPQSCMRRPALSPACHELDVLGQALVQRGQVERFGVEGAADPLQHGVVFLMLRVADRFQEVLVTLRAATILGWAGPLTGKTARDALAGLAGQDLLDDHLVLPAVSEVVEQCEPRALRRDDLLKRHGKLILRVIHLSLRIGIVRAVDRELVKVAVRPAHRRLQDEIQVAQRGVRRDEHSAPDRGIDVKQSDS